MCHQWQNHRMLFNFCHFTATVECADADYWTWLSCCCSCQHVSYSKYRILSKLKYVPVCMPSVIYCLHPFFTEARNNHIPYFFFSFPNNTLIMTKAYFKQGCWRCTSSLMFLLVFKCMIWLNSWLYYRWPYPLLSRRAVTKGTYSKRNMTGNKSQPHPSYTGPG